MRSLISALTLGLTIPIAFAQTTIDASKRTDVKPIAKIERIGEKLVHPWGMDFLSDTEILVTERGGKLFHIDIPSKTQREVMGVPDVFSFRQGGLLDIKVDENDPSTIYFVIQNQMAIKHPQLLEKLF
jgi:glucose/arabinose dehydrogenase